MTWELWLYFGTLGLIVAFALACLIERPLSWPSFDRLRATLDNLRARYSPYWRGYQAGLRGPRQMTPRHLIGTWRG